MSSDNRIESLFQHFGNQPAPAQTERWQAMGGKVPYQPVELVAPGTSSPKLRVHSSDGNVVSVRYATVDAVLYTAANRELSLITRHGACVLKGQNLLALLDEFELERVKLVRPFDASKHEPPADGEPLITRIDWTTAKQAQEQVGRG